MENEVDYEEEYEDWKRKFDEIAKIHRTLKEPQEIEVLDLILTKQNAEDIINGSKKVEYRDFTDFYIKRVMDEEIVNALNCYKDNEQVKAICAPDEVKDVLDPVRIVNTIHFHNYNNTWSLDVECINNDLVFVDEEIADWICEEFGDLECLRLIEKEGEDFKPFYVFYFAIGKIIKRVNI